MEENDASEKKAYEDFENYQIDSGQLELLQKALSLHKAGDLVAATKVYHEVISLNPNNFEALHLLGLVYFVQRRLDDAESSIKQAIQCYPDAVIFHYNLTCILLAQNKQDEMVKHLDIVLKHEPENSAALAQYGYYYLIEKSYLKAQTSFEKAIKFDENCAHAFIGLGCLAEREGNTQIAIDNYEKALKIDANNYKALSNYATLLMSLGMYQEAHIMLSKVLDLDQYNETALNNLGLWYLNQNDLKKAHLYFFDALQVNSQFASSKINLGITCYKNKNYEDAICHFTDFLDGIANYMADANTDMDSLIGRTLVYLQLSYKENCNWDEYNKNNDKLLKMINETSLRIKTQLIEPVNAVKLCISDDIYERITKRFAAQSRKNAQLLNKIHPTVIDKKDKLRVGYLITDLNRNPMGHILSSIIPNHNKDTHDIYCLSLFESDNTITHQLEKNTVEFIQLQALSIKNRIDFLKELRLDVIIDMCGYTNKASPTLLFADLAPIQIEWLGFSRSMHAPEITHRVVSKDLISEDTYESERTQKIYLDTLCAVDKTVVKSNLLQNSNSKLLLGIDESSFVFANLQPTYAYSEYNFEMWLSIIKDIPNAILCLLAPSETVELVLKRHAEMKGVHSDRLCFIHPSQLKINFNLDFVDVLLDSTELSGLYESLMAIIQEIPVVSFPSNKEHTRYSSSLLKALNISETIVNSRDEYINVAQRIEKNEDFRISIKTKIADLERKSSLYKPKEFTEKLEKHMHEAWKSHESIDLTQVINIEAR